jgi:hypothetical protein
MLHVYLQLCFVFFLLYNGNVLIMDLEKKRWEAVHDDSV